MFKRQKPFRFGIQARISLTTILIVFAVTFALIFVAFAFIKKNMKESIAAQQFARLSNIGETLDQKFESRRVLLRVFAEAFPLEVIHTPALAQDFLVKHPGLKSSFDNVALLNTDGLLVGNYNGTGIGVYNIKDRDYFTETLRRKAGVISQPIKSRFTGIPQVVMTEPIFDERGKVVYVLVGALFLGNTSTFLGTLRDVKFGASGYLFILNTHSIVVHHPRASRILQVDGADGGSNPAVLKALAGFEGSAEALNRYGVYGLYSFKRLKETDWILGAIYPEEEAFAPIAAVRRNALLALMFLSAVAGIVSAGMMRRQLLPLLNLHRHMLAGGGRSVDAPGVLFRDDEVGDIGRAYEQVSAARTKFEEQLRKNAKKVSDILAHAGDAYVECDVSGVITEWNRQAEETFGWRRDEACGRKLDQLLIPENMRAAHLRGMLAFSKSGTGPIVNKRVEVLALHQSGRIIPIELSVAAVKDGGGYMANAFIRDISERRQTEARLAENERFLTTITDNSPALIGYADRDEIYRFANRSYQTMMGIDPSAMIGRSVRDMMGERIYAGIRGHIASALAGQRVHFELDMDEPPRPRHCMTDYIPDIAPDGAVRGFHIMVTDISARKSTELS